MRKLLLAIVVSIFTSIGSSFALANEGWYAGVSVGSTDVEDACTGLPAGISCDDSDTGFKLFGGKQASKNWGGEFGFIDLGEVTLSDPSGILVGFPATAKVEADGFFLAGTGTVPLGQNEKFALFGKLGVFLWDVTASASVAGFGSGSASDDGFSPMFGIGLKYDFTERFGIRGEWERFVDVGDAGTTGEADIDLITVGVVIWFGPKSANASSGTPTSSGTLTSSGKPIRCKGYGCPE